MTSGLLSALFGRRTPMVLQTESAECGLACLSMLAQRLGAEEYTLTRLRYVFGSPVRGITADQMIRMAAEIGLTARAVKLEFADLPQLGMPCILHWESNHCVVLERVGRTHAWIIDPSVGRRKLKRADLARSFTGLAIELSVSSDFRPSRRPPQLTILTFFKSVPGILSSLGHLLLLSVGIQALALLMPFYSQLVIDEVIPSGDVGLATLLLLGFGLIGALHILIMTLRGFSVLSFSSHVGFSWTNSLFHHLVRLPAEYFERRHLADVFSRFQSLGAVQGVVSNTIVETVMDGLMALTTFAVMMVYSPLLALIPLVALFFYVGVRAVTYGMHRDASQEAIVEGTKQNGFFLETLRAIPAIKMAAREPLRGAVWQTRVGAAIRASAKVTLLETLQKAGNMTAFTVESCLIVWLGAKAVIDGGFSVGMLVAFISYKMQFTGRATALVDKVMEFRLLSVHLERLSDIVVTDKETATEGPTSLPALAGQVSLHNACFRYSETLPFVFANAQFDIQPGECVAITGPSGCGKTTLLKVMMTLLRPSLGQVLADGHDLHAGNHVQGFRRQVAAVLQEDVLLSGTLADNIAFNDPNADQGWIESCARTAAIHEDIMSFPMGYLTLVGDMGAALSGGQKQRVLLARALYLRPRILFLDEATAHLDPQTESRIHQALAQLRMTRIIVAHRDTTLRIADRVIHLGGPQTQIYERTLGAVAG